jgi:hypothetical protein
MRAVESTGTEYSHALDADLNQKRVNNTDAAGGPDTPMQFMAGGNHQRPDSECTHASRRYRYGFVRLSRCGFNQGVG